MSRAVGRSIVAALLSALAGVVWLTLFYGLRSSLDIGFDENPPALVAGVYPVERDVATGRTFAWTGEHLNLQVPGLDRHVDWVLSLRARGARPEPRANPTLTFVADGVPLVTLRTSADFEDLRVTIPTRPARRGVSVSVLVAPTFVPGPTDPRTLGVMIDSISLAAAATALPPRGAVAGSALTAGAAGGAIALLGVTPGSAVGAGILVAAGSASLIGRGFGPYTGFPVNAARVSLAIAVALVIAAGTVQVVRARPLRNTARFVAALSASALLLKLLVLLHPDMPIGNAFLHARRLQEVLAGRTSFSAIAAAGGVFPAAPGLYVFAAPFAALVQRGPADLALLRVIVCAVDAAVAIALYGMIVRAGGDRIAGAIAVALYHLMPLEFGVQAAGNLAIAFAQSVAVAAFAIMAAAALRVERWTMVSVFSLVLAGAFLSHVSTFATLAATAAIVAALFRWRGGPALRSPALAIAAAVLAAAVIALALYYVHVIPAYRAELARIGVDSSTPAAELGGQAAALRDLAGHFGLPVLLLAPWGAAMLWRRGRADRLALSTAGWIAGCLVAVAFGVLTSIDTHHDLASIPAVAILAGIGASAGWTVGGNARAASAVLLAGAVIAGLRGWWMVLGGPS